MLQNDEIYEEWEKLNKRINQVLVILAFLIIAGLVGGVWIL